MNRNRVAGAWHLHTLLVAAFALLAAGAAAGQTGYKADPQGKDELWDVTSKMEMAGMPFAMPAQSNRVCIAKGNDAGTIPRSEGCTVVDSKHVGGKFTYRMTCKNGNNDYTASGETTSAANGYQGTMRMVGKMEGQQMDMSMSYTGTRSGACTLAAR
jgi:hypothetical protein